MSGDGRLLIVGAGQAGVQTASSARELGRQGPITLLGDESHPPYARPPLSKAFLDETATEDTPALRERAARAGRRMAGRAADVHVRGRPTSIAGSPCSCCSPGPRGG